MWNPAWSSQVHRKRLLCNFFFKAHSADTQLFPGNKEGSGQLSVLIKKEREKRWETDCLKPLKAYSVLAGISYVFFLFQTLICSTGLGKENVLLLPLYHSSETDAQLIQELWDNYSALWDNYSLKQNCWDSGLGKQEAGLLFVERSSLAGWGSFQLFISPLHLMIPHVHHIHSNTQ